MNLLSLDEYQQKARATAVFPKERGVEYTSLQLASEAGEVAGKVAKFIRGDTANAGQLMYDEFVQAVTLELGDVLWYVAALADQFGIVLSDVAHRNLDKVADRHTRGVVKGSGDNR